ncbi:MAG: carboxymuconolactone decarboxylase family protein [Hyphomicrobiaceae bacterium]
MQSDERRQAFKQAYIEARGYWAEFNEGLLEHSPEWLEAYLGYSSTPARCGPLSARMRELIYVAVDGSTTHLFQAGLEIHIRIALDVGCTAGELIEVLQIATMQGLDSVVLGMSILQEELNPQPVGDGPAIAADPVVAASDLLPTREEEQPWRALMARLSPEWIEALDHLGATAERTSRLTAQERALIRLALAASPTHLNAQAVRAQVRSALGLGATPEEIAQVFQLVAHLGLHACSEGVPAVVRAAAERAA